PVGTAYWPWIIVPDEKYNKFGEFKVSMAFDGKDELSFHRQIHDLYDQAVEQKRVEKSVKSIDKADPPFSRTKDGKLLLFRFKLKASVLAEGGRRWNNPNPKIFDGKAKLIEPAPEKFKLGTGSRIRVWFRPKPYFVKTAGLSLRLVAIQVITYKEYDP